MQRASLRQYHLAPLTAPSPPLVSLFAFPCVTSFHDYLLFHLTRYSPLLVALMLSLSYTLVFDVKLALFTNYRSCAGPYC